MCILDRVKIVEGKGAALRVNAGHSIVQPTAVVETATEPLPAPLQKHLLGGCTIDMPS